MMYYNMPTWAAVLMWAMFLVVFVPFCVMTSIIIYGFFKGYLRFGKRER